MPGKPLFNRSRIICGGYIDIVHGWRWLVSAAAVGLDAVEPLLQAIEQPHAGGGWELFDARPDFFGSILIVAIVTAVGTATMVILALAAILLS